LQTFFRNHLADRSRRHSGALLVADRSGEVVSSADATRSLFKCLRAFSEEHRCVTWCMLVIACRSGMAQGGCVTVEQPWKVNADFLGSL
jgi:hypothetical protein